jgi:hypothetical protein
MGIKSDCMCTVTTGDFDSDAVCYVLCLVHVMNYYNSLPCE